VLQLRAHSTHKREIMATRQLQACSAAHYRLRRAVEIKIDFILDKCSSKSLASDSEKGKLML
jgi:hypothetical protein